jgi:DNA-binding transcriptional LysR family regulator
MLPHVRTLELFRDRWVCVVSSSNTELGEAPLTLEDLARLSWVVAYLPDPGHPVTAPLPQQLALLGIHPRIAVRVDSYLAVPYLVAGSDRVALVQARLAERLAEGLGLRVLECPHETTEIVETLWWCEDHDEDPAHAWLRQTLLDVAASI